MRRRFLLSVFCLFLAVNSGSGWAAVPAPVLKWQHGGCYNSWCETGWYSSPAVADVTGDGVLDVIGSAYSIVALNGPTGELVWRVGSGHDRSESEVENVGRTWPSIVVADVNSDGIEEIVTAHGGGYVSVYDLDGYFLPGWPKRPTTWELRGLMVADLDGDGTAEIVVNGALGSRTNTWVYEHNGALRANWPQLSNDSGYAAGVYNDNSAAGDLDGDGLLELVVPSDVHYICAYTPAGGQLPAHAMYGDKGWGKVGVWEDLGVELRGWGACDGARSERYRTNFAGGAAVVADVDGNGLPEVVATGNVYDCAVGHPPGKYTGVYVYHRDRSRFAGSGFDWRSLPVDTGAPLSESYSQIESVQTNPVVVDLDGDGLREIIFSSYDGRVHAVWLDKTEHHNWPFSVYRPAEGVWRFASEPVVADLDNDGFAEVLFGSWTRKGSYLNGMLHILDYRGDVLHEIALPAAKSSSVSWNGALAAPRLANIDADADLEIVLNTAYSGFVAYDLPGSSEARVLWGSGRAGRVWRQQDMSDADKLAGVIRILRILAGQETVITPDPDGNGRTDLADALRYLQQLGP
ncbi:FG-GAP repeat domain-containing protein [Desulfofustis glycolicus]|uniref:Repeat domain-containing protein n=1 Tax=Desulfofustis glycolicus DSM 9705 TaxID=1121409 RepID=A0A1M5VQC3_9BACT|nr:VCBS repeat-containing protein [Desulfofustis glycolicus]SHH77442.1 Repeat domain-containing protein [Desulfofustis glycolicus DSM 9705]